MLFIAEAEHCPGIFESTIPNYIRVAFGRLLTAHLDGLHLLVAAPKICRIIESSSDFSHDDRAAAAKIRAKFVEYGSLPGNLNVFCKLVDDGTLTPRKEGQVWLVPFRWIAENPLRETQLVAEDLRDVQVLTGAAEDFKQKNHYRAFRVRIGAVPGGGGNTHRTFAQTALTEQRIAICIADSDKECPTASLGATASACMTISGAGLFDLRVTQGRTLENALPWRLLDAIRPNKPPQPSFEMANIERAHPAASKFLNVKRGIYGHDLNRLNGTQSGQFWDATRIGLGKEIKCCAAGCKADKLGNCSTIIAPGFGNSTLADAQAYIENTKHKTNRHEDYLPSPGAEEWLDLGRWVFEFGLSSSARRF